MQPTRRAGSRHQLAASLLVPCQLEHHQLFHCPTGDPQRNPPGWLQGGHFSQAIYRKRLGYQLAKCAARYARQNQVHDSMLEQQIVKKENPDTQEGVRHRLAKLYS